MRTAERAPAKINLGLAVLGRRDDGYHDIHTLMATLDVGDQLTLETIARGIELTVEGADLPGGPENLAYWAAAAYLDAAARPGGVRIVLRKELPVAAGLGGGSSDAAAVLRALAGLYPSGLDLHGLARTLGADVPFLVSGGAAVATGTGERLAPVELPPVHVVLANPGVPVSAADAYRNLAGRFGPPLDIERLVAELAVLPPPAGRAAGGEGQPGAPGERIPAWSGSPPPHPAGEQGERALARRDVFPYWNDLAVPVLERHPEVVDALLTLRRTGLRGVLMSGSGSTVFGLARSRNEAEAIAERVATERPGWWVRAASAQ